MDRVRDCAGDADLLARVATEGYRELYEASLSPTNAAQGEAGGGPPPGKSGFHVSDPTGDTAVSGIHIRMRVDAQKVASKLRKVIPILEEVEAIVKDAFLASDPEEELAKRLKALRELEQEERRQGRRAS